jgi:uncharacterized ferredoxin-like protein
MDSRKIEMTIVFEESNLDDLLRIICRGAEIAPTVSGLSDIQFAQLKKELEACAPSIVEEYVDGSSDSDFLSDFTRQFEVKDET